MFALLSIPLYFIRVRIYKNAYLAWGRTLLIGNLKNEAISLLVYPYVILT